MDTSEYIEFVVAEGERFAAAADLGELNVSIERCPDWDMRDLVRHLGLIHLWAAANVAFPKDNWLHVDDLEDLSEHWPDLAAWPQDKDLVTWYRSTLSNLVDVLRAAPLDLACFAFLPAPTPLTMWARRQASEIAIHRFDAENARGKTSMFEPDFAADMLDELLSGFAPRCRSLDLDGPHTLTVEATDVDQRWHVTMGPDGIATSRQKAEADLVMTGTASDLYLLMWNRASDSTVESRGDSSVMDVWRESHRVRWV